MKKIVLIFTAIVCFGYTMKAQTINIIQNPTMGGNGVYSSFIEYNNNLYFYYIDNSGGQIAKFDGNNIALLPQPPLSNSGYYFSPIVCNNLLYFQFKINKENKGEYCQLAKCDGNTVTLIENIDSTDVGFNTSGVSAPIVFNDNLYFQYSTKSVSGLKYKLAKYDGTKLILINNLNEDDNGVQGSFIVYNNNLYFNYCTAKFINQLAKYDGDTITLISNPNVVDYGFSGYPIVYNNNLYFTYQNSLSKFQLAKYDGNVITLISNPDGIDECGFDPIVNNNYMFFRFRAPSRNFGLANFDGNTINLIYSPNTSGYGFMGQGNIYNNNLYYSFSNNFNNSLAKYDGVSVSFINTISKSDYGFDGNGCGIIYNNKLYFQYRNSSDNYQLAQYDGLNLVLITNVDSVDRGVVGYPILFKNNLLFPYNGMQNFSVHLAKYSDQPAINAITINENSLLMFPNPVTNELTINNINQSCTISIYDLNGKLIINKISKSTTEKIDVSSLANGIYSIKINDKKGIKTDILIKQ